MIHIYMTVCLSQPPVCKPERAGRMFDFAYRCLQRYKAYLLLGIFIKYTQHLVNMIEHLCT